MTSKFQTQDLREWLSATQELGELEHVKGAHWDQELGAITEINNRRRGPCLLFDEIPDYPSGYRVVTGTTGSPARLGGMLGFPTDLGNAELVEALRAKPSEWEGLAGDFPPEYVQTGPILENVKSGKDINLLEFPVPKWHEKDGGRFIGTGSAAITKDFDSDWINLGAYRMMVHDEKSMNLYISPGKN